MPLGMIRHLLHYKKEAPMLERRALLRTTLAVALPPSTLTGCAQFESFFSSTPANIIVLTAHLDGASEVPSNGRLGEGDAVVRYNRETGELDWEVQYERMSGPITGAHIHGPAGPDANGPVVIQFSNTGVSPIKGRTRIRPVQARELVSGLWYVNLHTLAHPNGELRGQLRRKAS
jgi:hypothetical protein